MDYTKIVQEDDYIAHHGIKGQKWGFRRYQNPDGSLTEEGRRRYDIKEAKIKAKAEKVTAKAQVKSAKLAAKTEKLAAKNLKKATKEQAKLLKLDMKRLKKTAAYEKGKKFGEGFAEQFGKNFGESVGSGLGNAMFNWQKWRDLRNTKYSNETARRLQELRERAYDDDALDVLKDLSTKSKK